jgi:hypothetical protein
MAHIGRFFSVWISAFSEPAAQSWGTPLKIPSQQQHNHEKHQVPKTPDVPPLAVQ